MTRRFVFHTNIGQHAMTHGMAGTLHFDACKQTCY